MDKQRLDLAALHPVDEISHFLRAGRTMIRIFIRAKAVKGTRRRALPKLSVSALKARTASAVCKTIAHAQGGAAGNGNRMRSFNDQLCDVLAAFPVSHRTSEATASRSTVGKGLRDRAAFGFRHESANRQRNQALGPGQDRDPLIRLGSRFETSAIRIG